MPMPMNAEKKAFLESIDLAWDLARLKFLSSAIPDAQAGRDFIASRHGQIKRECAEREKEIEFELLDTALVGTERKPTADERKREWDRAGLLWSTNGYTCACGLRSAQAHCVS